MSGEAQASAQAPTLAAPVAEVTVLEDRAHVIRAGKIILKQGTTRVRVLGVAPVLADRTLSATIVAAGGGEGGARVNDASVHRRWIMSPEEATVDTRALVDEARALADRIHGQRCELDRLDRELRDLVALAGATAADLAEDVSWGALPAEVRARLGELADAEWQLRAKRLELAEQIRRADEDRERLEQRIAASLTTSDTMVAELRLELVAEAAGAYLVRIDYVVPCACWRPYHRAELGPAGEGDPAKHSLRFTSDGCVWQNTGEGWDGVELVFSTERPSLGAEPPELVDDLLFTQKRQEVLEVAVRQQEIQTTGEGADPETTVDELPGIDDGGEALELRALHRASIPSDGRPHRVPLMAFETDAELTRVVTAELAAAAILKTTQTNRGAHPILAGPVDLVRGGGLTGRGALLFVAPGERFALGWGPDGEIRVTRVVDSATPDSRMLSSWTTTKKTVTLRLSNLGDEPRAITVKERVPVSEIEKVKIAVDPRETTGKKRPDRDGIVTWDVRVPGLGREELKLVYEVKKHADVKGI